MDAACRHRCERTQVDLVQLLKHMLELVCDELDRDRSRSGCVTAARCPPSCVVDTTVRARVRSPLSGRDQSSTTTIRGAFAMRAHCRRNVGDSRSMRRPRHERPPARRGWTAATAPGAARRRYRRCATPVRVRSASRGTSGVDENAAVPDCANAGTATTNRAANTAIATAGVRVRNMDSETSSRAGKFTFPVSWT